MLAYLFEGVKSIGHIKPIHLSFKCDDREIEGDFLFGAISNSMSVGGVIKYKDAVVKEGKKLYDIFSKNKDKDITIYSPKMPYISKINGKYRVQMILKTKNMNKVIDNIYEILDIYDKIKNRNVNISVIKNPIKMG